MFSFHVVSCAKVMHSVLKSRSTKFGAPWIAPGSCESICGAGTWNPTAGAAPPFFLQQERSWQQKFISPSSELLWTPWEQKWMIKWQLNKNSALRENTWENHIQHQQQTHTGLSTSPLWEVFHGMPGFLQWSTSLPWALCWYDLADVPHEWVDIICITSMAVMSAKCYRHLHSC